MGGCNQQALAIDWDLRYSTNIGGYMLPSGFTGATNEDYRTSEIVTGLYAVEDAYAGDYDFFSPSSLYTTSHESNTEPTKK